MVINLFGVFAGMPAQHNHHFIKCSTAALAELRTLAVPGWFSCSLPCKDRKCKYIVLFFGGFEPLISSAKHFSNSQIFSFSLDVVVILEKFTTKNSTNYCTAIFLHGNIH